MWHSQLTSMMHSIDWPYDWFFHNYCPRLPATLNGFVPGLARLRKHVRLL